MKRIALYGGYFVAVFLLAAYLTGVLQQGMLSRGDQQATAAEQEEPSGDSDHPTTPGEPDQALDMAPTPESGLPAEPSDGTTSIQPGSQMPRGSAVAASMQASPMTGSSITPSGDPQSPIANQEKALAEKRAELQRLEEQIRKLKEEGEIEGKWLAELRASRTTLIKERDAKREAGVKKLAKLYEGKEPEAAASILSKLKQEMAIEVLASMRDRQASKVLAAMNGNKAKEISEHLEQAKLVQIDGPAQDGRSTRESSRD